MAKEKHQLIIQHDSNSLSDDEIEKFVKKAGEDNVEILMASTILNFGQDMPVLRLVIDGWNTHTSYGQDAINYLREFNLRGEEVLTELQ